MIKIIITPYMLRKYIKLKNDVIKIIMFVIFNIFDNDFYYFKNKTVIYFQNDLVNY